MSDDLSVSLSPDSLELLATRVAEIIGLPNQPEEKPPSPCMSVAEAAEYLRGVRRTVRPSSVQGARRGG